MKHIYKLSAFLLTLLLFTSCDEDLIVYDVDGGQTLVSFAKSSDNLPIVIDSNGSVDVTVNVTTRTSADRTFDIMVDPSSNALPGSYTVPSSVTIPANSFNGTFTVNGTDADVTTEARSLVLRIGEGGGYLTEGNLNLSVFQICPVSTDLFTGNYQVTVLSPGVFGAGTYGPDGGTVNISVGGSDLERVFTADYFSDSRFPRDFRFSLVCNEIVIPYQDHLVGCGGNNVNLSTGPAAMKGTYDPNDDGSFTITLTDNVDSDCGGGPVVAMYQFDKI